MAPPNRRSTPGWAHLQPQEDEERRTAEEEDQYLRSRAYQAVSKRIDNAFAHAMREHTRDAVDEIMKFFSCFLPKETHSEEDAESKTVLEELRDLLAMDLDEEEDESAQDDNFYAFQPATSFEPLTLPIAMVQTPSSLLDREEAAKWLVDGLKSWNRPAISVIQCDPAAHNIGPLMNEIARQCIQQDHIPNDFLALLTKRKSTFPATDVLTSWANETASFDSIVVVLENVEELPSTLLQDLVQRLAKLRAVDGIPVNVVLLDVAVGKPPIQFRSSVQGPMGYCPHHISLPQAKSLFERLLKLLVLDDSYRIPIFLPPEVIRRIREVFKNYRASSAISVAMIKKAVAHHFEQKASFFSAMQCQEFMKFEWKRVAWCCTDKTARSVVIGEEYRGVAGSDIEGFLRDMEQSRMHLWLILRMLHHIFNSRRSVDEWLALTFSPEIPQSLLSGMFRNASRTDVLTLLVQCRNELNADGRCNEIDERQSFNLLLSNGNPKNMDTDSPLLSAMKKRMNETIILVGNTSEEMLKGRGDIEEIVDEWVRSIFSHVQSITKRLQSNRYPLGSCSMLPGVQGEKIASLLMPEMRRQVASALIERPSQILSGRKDSNTISSVPSLLFRSIRERVSITRDEWFDLFSKDFDGSRSQDELWHMFAFGVYQLLHSGLVREKTSHRKAGYVYERTALVWCSGS